MPVEVAHPGGYRGVSGFRSEKGCGDGLHERFVSGGVDWHRGVEGENVAEAGGVVAMAVGEHDEVDLRQIDVQLFNVGFEFCGIVSRVEEDALAIEFDEGGVTPIQRDAGFGREGIVEDGDLVVRRPRLGGAGGHQRCGEYEGYAEQ